MAPGRTQEENLRFITFIVNTLMAVYRHNGLLKASILSATNAHRLGANEGTARHHLVLPGHAAEPRAGPHGGKLHRRPHRPGRQARPEAGHPADTRAAHRQHRPQPHLTLRLHGQPVRVPRRRLGGQLRQCHDSPEHGDGRAADTVQARRGRTHRAGRAQGERHHTSGARVHQAEQAHPLRRQRLQRRVEGRGTAAGAGLRDVVPRPSSTSTLRRRRWPCSSPWA